MLITFSVNDQKVTHDLTRPLVAGSSGIDRATFQFDSSWDGMKVAVVFTNSHCEKPMPVRYDGGVIDIPPEVLKPGKLYVSCVGFGNNGSRKTTQAWDIQQAITVQNCGDLGFCELLRNMVDSTGGEVPEEDVASDEDVETMLEGVFGGTDVEEDPPQPISSVENVASDEDVARMLDVVFSTGGATEYP